MSEFFRMHETERSVRLPGLPGWPSMSRWRNPSISAYATVFYALTLALLGAFVVLAAVGRGGGAAGQLTYYMVEIAASAGALTRALRRPDRRLQWLLLALGLTLFTVGDVYWELRYGTSDGPAVSLADVFYLAFYPCVLVSMILLMRRRVRATARTTVWLDGIISGLAAGALCAALTFGQVVSLTGGAPLTVTVNVAYPVADLVLGSLVVAIIGMRGWRLDATWLWLLAGLLIFAVGDSAYLYEDAAGGYVNGGMLDTLWPLALLLMSFAGWQHTREDTFLPEESHGIALPTALGAFALLLLVYDHFHRVHIVAVTMAGATLAAMLARFVLTFRTSQRLLVTRRNQAITDQLTGIPNRRALVSTLEHELRGGSRKRTLLLALFDLDGFKDYNDTFGHPAGDLLLVRLARRLDDTARRAGARAYRMGGDEFCLLARWPEDESPDSLMALAINALTESGRAFTIGASGGHTLVHPGEVTVAEAMRARRSADVPGQERGTSLSPPADQGCAARSSGAEPTRTRRADPRDRRTRWAGRAAAGTAGRRGSPCPAHGSVTRHRQARRSGRRAQQGGQPDHRGAAMAATPDACGGADRFSGARAGADRPPDPLEQRALGRHGGP